MTDDRSGPRRRHVVLAAGTSSRMGANRLPRLGGTSVLRRAVGPRASGAPPVLVGWPTERENARRSSRVCLAPTVLNPDFASGP